MDSYLDGPLDAFLDAATYFAGFSHKFSPQRKLNELEHLTNALGYATGVFDDDEA